MKAIIVDDEPRAIELINGYLKHFSEIEVVGTFRNGLKAFELINQGGVDLVFLDINMPHLSGISLSKMMPGDTKIIFTTAYSEFAAESYEVNAVDYLLKPISLERFTKAMGKVIGQPVKSGSNKMPGKLILKSGNKTYRISPDDIYFLEKDGNYMEYHLKSEKVLTRETMAEALENLPDSFIRIHKSFVINLHRINFTTKEEVSIHERAIPIGSQYKAELENKLL